MSVIVPIAGTAANHPDAASTPLQPHPSSLAVVRFDSRTHLWTQWSLPAGSFPNRITVDGSGDVWFTELVGQSVDEIDTSGHLHRFPVAGGPVGIVYHAGRLYTALYNAGELGELDLHGHVLATVPLPDAAAVLQLTVRGSHVWVVDAGSQRIYRVVATC